MDKKTNNYYEMYEVEINKQRFLMGIQPEEANVIIVNNVDDSGGLEELAGFSPTRDFANTVFHTKSGKRYLSYQILEFGRRLIDAK